MNEVSRMMSNKDRSDCEERSEYKYWIKDYSHESIIELRNHKKRCEREMSTELTKCDERIN